MRIRTFVKRVKYSLAAGLVIFSGSLPADDIEIYNTARTLPYPPYQQIGDIEPPNPNYPNVLFVLDASASMNARDKKSGFTTSRLSRLREAMSIVLQSANKVNIGVMRFSQSNSGGRIIYPMSPIEYAREDAMNTINNMDVGYWTPTIGALLEAAYYFSGKKVYYGRSRVREYSNKHFAIHLSRVSHPESYTGGTVVRDENCTDNNLDHISCENEKIDGDPVYISPILNECQKNYMVVVTDGGATGRVNIPLAEELIGSSCVWADKRANTCGVELAEYMTTTDLSTEIPGVNTVSTYTVGFNTRLEPLKDMAAAGNGKYFESGSADELAATLTAVLNEASLPAITFAAPSVSVDPDTLFSNRNDIYLSVFEPSLNPVWSGNLKGYWYDGVLKDYSVPRISAIDSSSGLIRGDAKSQWSTVPDGNTIASGGAAEKIKNTEQRWIVTNNPHGPTQLLDDKNRITTELITATELGLPDRILQLEVDDAQSLINWTNGLDERDWDEDGITDENRRQYGDPLHSNPIVITYGKNTSDTYDSVVYFGTNEGFLHAVDTNSGEDIFSFVPWDLLDILKHAYVNMPYAKKLYGMDGYLTTWINDTDNNGFIDNSKDFAYLLAGMRRGGRDYHALDVSNKESPVYLWKITGGTGEFKELGQTWSKMIHGKMRHPDTGKLTDVLVFSGGYDDRQDDVTVTTTDEQGRAIYIVEAETGNLVWNAGLTDAALNFPEMQYSFPASPAVVDINGDGLFDQIYAGDMGGQIWRFDFPVDGEISGGVIADVSAEDNMPRRFFTSADVALVDPNEQSAYLTISLGTGSRSQPLATENNAFYVIRQEHKAGTPDGYGYKPANFDTYQPITPNQLVDLTSNKIVEGSSEEKTDIANQLIQSHGWYIMMEEHGEKVLNTSITLDNKVVFTSYVPGKQSECSIDPGSNNLYILSLLDGGPAIDNDEDGLLRKSDRKITLNTPGISAPPSSIFSTTPDGDTKVTVLVGTESKDMGELPLSRRTFWIERPEI